VFVAYVPCLCLCSCVCVCVRVFVCLQSNDELGDVVASGTFGVVLQLMPFSREKDDVRRLTAYLRLHMTYFISPPLRVFARVSFFASSSTCRSQISIPLSPTLSSFATFLRHVCFFSLPFFRVFFTCNDILRRTKHVLFKIPVSRT